MSNWTVQWLGHSGFRIETGGAVILIDPWLRGNPSFDEARFDEAVSGATHLLLSHAHGDHSSSAQEIVEKTDATLVAIYDLTQLLGVDGAVGMNKGGTVALTDAVSATMVHAVHSSSIEIDGASRYGGGEAGFMIRSGAETLYFAGDTDVFADMAIFEELHKPKFGILPIGGHFTMDADRAAFAAKKFFNFETIIPCHYQTFPLLAQSADPFAAAVAPTRVMAPSVMEKIIL
ncbi:MAG: metal-dependent hydrolase [Neomegalonema sp.]|nr:metal-dependent hydrolase [Neomegalonema sp.]